MRKILVRSVFGDEIHAEYRHQGKLTDEQNVLLAATSYILEKGLGALSMNWYIRDYCWLRLYTGIVQVVGSRKQRFEYVGSNDSRALALEVVYADNVKAVKR